MCAERTQYTGFGQFVVEMAGPGPREAGLDDTLPARTQVVSLSGSASRKTPIGYDTGTQVSVWCEEAAHVRFGDTTVTASTQDELLPARQRKDVVTSANGGFVAFLAQATPDGQAPRCHVAANTHTRMLLITRDAVPDLRVDCDENDTDAERARQCRFLHGATYDVVGHLRQVQAARPRWTVMPRDADDLCCHPGVGLECPKPVQPCK